MNTLINTCGKDNINGYVRKDDEKDNIDVKIYPSILELRPTGVEHLPEALRTADLFPVL